MSDPATITIAEQSRQADGSFAVRVAFGEGVEYDVTVADPADERVEGELAWYFEEHLRYPFLDHDRRDASTRLIADYGQSLFAQLFTGPAAVDYQVRRRRGFDGCRIVVSGSAEFHRLHWEAIRDPADREALSVRMPMMRRVQRQPARFDVPAARPTLNILVVTARPDGPKDVGYRTISRPLLDTLRKARLPVTVDLVRPGTWQALRDRLQAATDEHGSGWYQVIHFDLHGGVGDWATLEASREAGRLLFAPGRLAPFDATRAFLFFETATEGVAEPVTASDVSDLLARHRVPVAVLNACQSAMDTGSEASLAQQLVQAGVPVAVGMAYSVTVSAAERAMPILYGRLAAGSEPIAAVHAARRQLYEHQSRRAFFEQSIELEDWLLPVAFQQQPVDLRPTTMTGEQERRFLEREASIGQEPVTEYGFVGRDLDIQAIERRLLTDGSPNQVLVQGLAGSGKSTLLAYLGWWWQRTGLVRNVWRFSFEHRAWTAAQIVREIAGSLLSPPELAEFDSYPEHIRAERVARELRAHPHLLIIDNVESITAAPAAIPHALSGPERDRLKAFLASLREGRTLVLYGSREAETWLATGTFHSNVYPLPGLDAQAASALVERIIARHDLTSRFDDAAEHDALARIIELLGGYPLPLTVVLPALKTTPASTLYTQLSAGSTDADPSGLLQRAIEYSYAGLDPAMQRSMLLLAPFTASLPVGRPLAVYQRILESAEVVRSLGPIDLEAAVQETTRAGLTAPSLALPDFVTEVPILPYFLRMRLREQPEELNNIAIASHYLLQRLIAKEIHEMLKSNTPDELARGRIAARELYPNLVAAIEFGIHHRQPTNIIVKCVYEYLAQAEQHETLQGLLAKAIADYPEPATDAARFELYDLHDLAGRTAYKLHQYDQAEIHFLTELALKKTMGDRSTYINTYGDLGKIAYDHSRFDEAEAYYRQALDISLEFGDRAHEAQARHELGILAQHRDQSDEAEHQYRLALQIISEDELVDSAHTRAQLGQLLQDQGDLEGAAEQYVECLKIETMLGKRRDTAITLNQLGNLALDRGDYQQAQVYCRRALEVSLEFNDQRTMGYAYNLLSAVARHEQRPAEAERYSRQALAAFIETRDLHNMSLAYQHLGDALWDQGSRVEALKAMLTGVMLWSQATGTLALDRMGPLREVRAAMADEIVQELVRAEVPEDLVGDLLAHLAEPQA